MSAQQQLVSEEMQVHSEAIESSSQDATRGDKKDAGFVAVPIPITSPAIGYGLAVAGLYMHGKDQPHLPTNMTGAFALYTDNDSWMSGMMHSGHYGSDRHRVTAGSGYGDFNLKFYGFGSDPILNDRPITYNIHGPFALARYQRKLADSTWFLGPSYVGYFLDVKVDIGSIIPDAPQLENDIDNVGLGLVLTHDSRDDNINPRSGIKLDISAHNFGKAIGSDRHYSKSEIQHRQYHHVLTDSTLAWRLRWEGSGKNSPFFSKSRLKLRGFEQGRYTDDHAIEGEGELRYNLSEQWTAIGGFGIGTVFGDSRLDQDTSLRAIWSTVIGARYVPAGGAGMKIGTDIAISNDDWNFYITIGNAF